ncbi:sortase [Streptacidiphilus sp. EB103A]|uniref:sortase n=1 Tax=Streptacidiphilus sp. EB103A TaxID=3156275 RepID=UPI003516D0C9
MPRSPMPPHTRNRIIIGAAALSLFALGADAAWTTDWNPQPTHPAALTITAAPTTNATAAPTATTSGDPLTGANPTTTASDHTTAAPGDAQRALTTWRSSNPAPSAQAGTSGAAGTITEVLRVPALGADWAEPIYEGVGVTQLAAGVGHFPGTEQPGQVGNFAIAGHRSGVADPAFRNITAITPGSLIEVTTAQRITYTYTVTATSTVAPTDVDVIAQVPGHPDQTPTRAELTLITCWPADGHAKRVVVQAVLTAQTGGA